ncbi:MAG TPA: polysaccharide biosynthesis/export family protein [Pyrinomonadaceae bacterium]|nr:polysaccharide biosynthesis/export family protein [Pyrinomonadaceae bacterium]
MKKRLIQTLVLAIALAITVTTFAQSPNNSTRQRRTSADGTQQATAGTNATDKATGTSADKTAEAKDEKDKDKAKNPDVTSDAKTNRIDESSEEDAIVPYYNNFFASYRLGPEDVISVNVFNQDRYSKQGIKVPPSGRIYLPLISEGIFVNGKTVDQVSEIVKKRYDEYIINPQVSVSLDQAGSYRYSVVGDVGAPGIKLMTRRLSVTEAVAEAGGVLQTGNRSRVVVLRKQADGTLKPIPVNLSAVYKGQAPDSVYLVPGDQVIVPGNKLKKLQTILGFTQVLSFANLFRGGIF